MRVNAATEKPMTLAAAAAGGALIITARDAASNDFISICNYPPNGARLTPGVAIHRTRTSSNFFQCSDDHIVRSCHMKGFVGGNVLGSNASSRICQSAELLKRNSENCESKVWSRALPRRTVQNKRRFQI